MKKKIVLKLMGILICVSSFSFLIYIIGNNNKYFQKEPIVQNKDKQAKIHVNKNDKNLVLVNQKNSLPENWDVDLTVLKSGHSISSEAYPDLQKMFDDMRNVGLKPLICSSYRTYDKQESLFNNKMNQYLKEGDAQEVASYKAASWVAKPNYSEHQTGLALDIVATDYQLLDENQENTAEQKWLIENSWKYGFILRYPSEKSQLTYVNYEPWHYRYVGKNAAKTIYENNLCLEEYLNID